MSTQRSRIITFRPLFLFSLLFIISLYVYSFEDQFPPEYSSNTVKSHSQAILDRFLTVNILKQEKKAETLDISSRQRKLQGYQLCNDPENEFAYPNGDCLPTCDTSANKYLAGSQVINGLTQQICKPCDAVCGTCQEETYICLTCASAEYELTPLGDGSQNTCTLKTNSPTQGNNSGDLSNGESVTSPGDTGPVQGTPDNSVDQPPEAVDGSSEGPPEEPSPGPTGSTDSPGNTNTDNNQEPIDSSNPSDPPDSITNPDLEPTIDSDGQTDSNIVTIPNISPIVKTYIDYHDATKTIVTTQLVALQVLNCGTQTAIPVLLILELLEYIKYLDINYPQNVANIFEGTSYIPISFNFGPALPDKLEEIADNYIPPPRFAKTLSSSLFLANFWQAFTTILILVALIGLLKFISRITFKNSIVNAGLNMLQVLLIWNQMLTYWMSNLGKVFVFSILEYHSLRLDGSFPGFSFFFALLFFIGSCILFIYIPIKLYRIRRYLRYDSFEAKVKAHRSIKVLFEYSRNLYFIQEAQVCLIALRVIVHSFIISIMNSPIAQLSLLVILNLVMIAYFVKYTPNRRTKTNIEYITYELIVLATNCACLRLATQDKSQQALDTNAGDAIIGCNFAIFAAILFFQALETKDFILDLIGYWIAKKKLPAKARYFDEDILDLTSRQVTQVPIKKNEMCFLNLEEDEDEDRLDATGSDDICEIDELPTASSTPKTDCGEPQFDENAKDTGEGDHAILIRYMQENITHMPDRSCPSLGIPVERQTKDRLKPYFSSA